MNAPFAPLTLSMRDVIELAAGYFDVPMADMVSPSHEPDHVHARHVAMFAIRGLLGRSYPQIGRIFGGRDHTTVINAVRKVSGRMEWDTDLRGQVETFLAICRLAKPLRAPDVDPFEAARRVMASPTLAHRVSIATIKDFAAIVSAAITEASANAELEHELEAYRAAFEAIEPRMAEFVQALKAFSAASDRARDVALQRFEVAARALVDAFQQHFNLERKTS